MWKSIYESLKQILLLTEQTQQNRTEVAAVRAELAEMREEMRTLATVVQHLIREMNHNREHETDEREKMALRLENEMLKFERRLPRSRQDEDS